VSESVFKMPVPHIGQAVLFYPRAIVNRSTGVLGYVLSTNPHNIELVVRGVIHEGVKHRDDPELQTNQHCREFGCWEASPWDAELQRRLSDLESRVHELMHGSNGKVVKDEKAMPAVPRAKANARN